MMSFSLLISFDFETIKNMKLFQIVNHVVMLLNQGKVIHMVSFSTRSNYVFS